MSAESAEVTSVVEEWRRVAKADMSGITRTAMKSWDILRDPIEVYVDDVKVDVLAMGHLNAGPDADTLVVHCTTSLSARGTTDG